MERDTPKPAREPMPATTAAPLTRPTWLRLGVAAALSLYRPGLGHPVLGRWRRGLVWLLVFLLNGAAIVYAPGATLTRLFVVTLIGVWLAAAVDVLVVGRAAHIVPRPGKALGMVLGVLALWLVLAGLLRSQVVEAFKIPSGSMMPALEVGDHVLVEKLVHRLGEPARGEVVVFERPHDPGRRMFVHRVVAVGNDTVEVRCGVLYVNGEVVVQELVAGDSACTYWDRVFDEGWVSRECSRYRETLDGRRYEVLFLPERPGWQRAGSEGTMDSIRSDFPHPQRLRFPEGGGADQGRFARSVAGDVADPCALQAHYVVPEGHVFVMGDNRDNASDSRWWGPVPVDSVLGKVASIWWSEGPEQQGIRWPRIGTHVQ